MDLRHLDDKTLLAETKAAVVVERGALIAVLYHLREVGRRRLYSTLACSSLQVYAEKELGYPPDQAYRRIAAMKLLCEIPEVASRIADGRLNITNLSLANSHFQAERKVREVTRAEKIEVLEKVAEVSTRQAVKLLVSRSSHPESVQPDRVRVVNEKTSELRACVSEEVLAKLARVRGLIAHTHPNPTMDELLSLLCELALKTWTPSQPKAKFAAPLKMKKATVREVWRRDQECCRICKSTYALEPDHVLPRAMGGSDELENLRLLCKSCNQRKAIEAFGIGKMDGYLNPARRAP
jgi:hypothetical protein